MEIRVRAWELHFRQDVGAIQEGFANTYGTVITDSEEEDCMVDPPLLWWVLSRLERIYVVGYRALKRCCIMFRDHWPLSHLL